MNVLLISSGTPVRGGVSTYINTVANKLRSMEHKVKVIGVSGSSSDEFNLFSSYVIRAAELLFSLNIFFIFGLRILQLILRIKVSRELNKGDYSIIHAQDINSANACGAMCASKGIRLIMTVHGHPHQGTMAIKKVKPDSWLSSFLLNEEIKAYRKCNHIITVSDYSYDLIKGYKDETMISVIHNFVDRTHFYQFDSKIREQLRTSMGYKNNDFILIYAG